MFLNICKVFIFVFLFCINCMNVCVIGELGKEVDEKMKEGLELHDLKSNITEGADGIEDSDAANSDDLEKCKADFSQCIETGGQCSSAWPDGKIKCTCPQDTAYVAEVGCKADPVKCEQEFPNCEGTMGKCLSNNEGKINCRCPADTVYKSNEGCQVTNYTCSDRYPFCEETGGSCIENKDNDILCNCPAGTKYNNDTGCKTTSTDCWYEHPYCEETGGYCIKNKENETLCKCPTRAVYNADKGCEVKGFECRFYHRYCEETGGFCVKNKDKKVMCRCTTDGGSIKQDDLYARYVYNISKGCEVTGVECWYHYALCKETGGYCTKNKDKKIICNCPKDTVYKTGKGCLVSDPCNDNPCENDGRCVTVGKNFKCICKQPYSGRVCEINLCENIFCHQNGICKVKDGRPTCYYEHPHDREYWNTLAALHIRFIIFASIIAILSLTGIITSCIVCCRIRSMKAV